MGWMLTEGEDGYMLSKTAGHMAEAWGVLLSQEKAMHVLEVLTWAETLEGAGVVPAPPKPKPRRKR